MAMTLITTNTSSDAASSSFTSSIDSTYKLYIFKFIDIHPEASAAKLGVQFNVAGASGYNETITSTFFDAEHSEADDAATLGYKTAVDQAQGTGVQWLTREIGGENDESGAGTLWLFNPSNTTYVTHFYSRFSSHYHADYIMDNFVAGYINATGAVDEVQFTVESDNFNGTIKMYGVG
jgi:hypothetical protein